MSNSSNSSTGSTKELKLLEVVEMAESYLRDLKSEITNSNGGNGNGIGGAAAVLGGEGLNGLKSCVNWMEKYAKKKESEVWDDLYSFLNENHATWPKMMFWSCFEKKLKSLEACNVTFRKICLHRSLESNGNCLAHEVCKFNPPIRVLKTLLDITPDDENARYNFRYDHRSRNHDHEFPLQMLIRNGGSVELIKFLVEHDKERETLKGCGSYNNTSVMHTLMECRQEHSEKAFSDILRYLVEKNSAVDFKRKDNKMPLALLYDSFKEDGLSVSIESNV